MGQEKGENSAMSYLNSITLVGFVGSDPEQRQAKGNGSKFTVLSVATQRSWKNADDEWSSKTEWHRVVVFRPLLAERVATTIKKGAHVLVEGSLVSSTYEQPNGKGKKSKTSKITSWSVRADVVRRLDRGEPEPTRLLPPKRRSPTKLRSDVFDTKALRRCRRAFSISCVNDQSAASIWTSAVSRS
jgi:single-strand DNA-binding protein